MLSPTRPQPADRNPSVPCDICGDSYGGQDYWASRWKMSNPEDSRAICDVCLERADEMHDRITQNQPLDKFTEGER